MCGENFDVTIVCSSQEREKNLREFLIREKLDGRDRHEAGNPYSRHGIHR